jgi:dipeptidyl aminopeptidase/acylaminoacyl peptidase
MLPKNFRTTFAVAVLFLLSVCVSAQQRFTLEQVMSAPFPSNLTVAEHSGRIAWVFNAKGVRNVWIADAPDFKARQLTRYTDDGTPIASVRLTPDGKTVLYTRGSETNRQGEVANPANSTTQPHQQVWALDIEGGEPRLLGTMECQGEDCENIQVSPDGKWAVWSAKNNLWIVPIAGTPPATGAEPVKAGGPAKQLAYVRGNNRDPHWSPDSKRIAFTSIRGDHSFIGIYEFGRDTIQYMAPDVDRDIFPRWSPDGRQLAFVRLRGAQQNLPLIPERTTPWAIWVGDPETGAAKQIWHSTNEPNGSFPGQIAEDAFNFTGGRITFASEQDGWGHMYSIPTSGGQPTLLTPGKFDIENVAVSHDSKSLIYTSNQDDIDRRHIWSVAVTGGLMHPLTVGEPSMGNRDDRSIEWSPLETGDGSTMVFFRSSATMPPMPYRLGEVIHHMVRLGEMIAKEALPADFPSAQLVTPQQVIFKSEDGWEIHGQLFVPREKKQNMPALIFTHGGSRRQMMLGFHNMYYYSNAYAENQYLASLGYVVLSVNYRTGIMYGRAFREAAHTGMRGGDEYKDVAAGGRYLQSLPYVDKAKIGLWGGSYGGYLTAMGLAHNSDIFKAGVDMHGVHDWWMTRNGPGTFVGAPDAQAAEKLAWESSPNSWIGKWTSPVLLIQGDDDRNVPFTQTVDLAQRLRAQKVPFETLVFPDEIHDFLKWKSWVRAYDAGARFFDRVLKNGERIAVPQ